MYKTNDYVVHSVKGLCTVGDKGFPDGIDYECYLISPVAMPNMQMYIPVSNSDILRDVMTERQAKDVIEMLPKCNMDIAPNTRVKSNDYKKILNKPTMENLCAMVKILYTRQLNKEKNTADTSILKSAEELLLTELSFVLNISEEKIREKIMSELS